MRDASAVGCAVGRSAGSRRSDRASLLQRSPLVVGVGGAAAAGAGMPGVI